MKLEKSHFIKSMVFMFILLIFLPGIQGIKHGSTSYSGMIGSIDKDFKFIVVNGVKIIISADTKIADEKGNTLKADDLKVKLSVVIEGVSSPEGFFAKKIVVAVPKKKP